MKKSELRKLIKETIKEIQRAPQIYKGDGTADHDKILCLCGSERTLDEQMLDQINLICSHNCCVSGARVC